MKLAKVGLRRWLGELGAALLVLLPASEAGCSSALREAWLFPGETTMLDVIELSTISWLSLVSKTRGLLVMPVGLLPSVRRLREEEQGSAEGEPGDDGKAPADSVLPCGEAPHGGVPAAGVGRAVASTGGDDGWQLCKTKDWDSRGTFVWNGKSPTRTLAGDALPPRGGLERGAKQAPILGSHPRPSTTGCRPLQSLFLGMLCSVEAPAGAPLLKHPCQPLQRSTLT